MAVIVRHRETGAEYILLGAGLGAWKASMPGVLFGSLSPHEDSGTLKAVLVCDAQGKATWIHSEDLEILSVDGEKPSEVLTQGTSTADAGG